jgi:hypothetical protein
VLGRGLPGAMLAAVGTGNPSLQAARGLIAVTGLPRAMATAAGMGELSL